MRKLIYMAFAAFALGACTLETSGNGDLDGYWQLHQLDSLHNGASVDMRQQSVFWGVQVNLLRAWKIGSSSFFFRFTHTGDSLFLSDPYVDLRDSSDIKVTDAERLRPVGVNKLEERFAVLLLDGDKMTLQSDKLRLHFRKY